MRGVSGRVAHGRVVTCRARGRGREEQPVPRCGKPVWADKTLSHVCPVSWHVFEPVYK